MNERVSPLRGKTTDWRAGCGRSARPVRREGSRNPMRLAYPYQTLGIKFQNRNKYNKFPETEDSTFDYQRLAIAIATRDRSYKLLTWISDAIDKGLILPSRAAHHSGGPKAAIDGCAPTMKSFRKTFVQVDRKLMSSQHSSAHI